GLGGLRPSRAPGAEAAHADGAHATASRSERTKHFIAATLSGSVHRGNYAACAVAEPHTITIALGPTGHRDAVVVGDESAFFAIRKLNWALTAPGQFQHAPV